MLFLFYQLEAKIRFSKPFQMFGRRVYFETFHMKGKIFALIVKFIVSKMRETLLG